MSTITDIYRGATANDNTGTTAREAGQIINDNFDNLNADKLEQSDIDSQLGNVDNTSDLDKPVSTATQTALNSKVDKVSGKSLIDDTKIAKLDGIEPGAEVNVGEEYTTTEKNKVSNLPANQNDVNASKQDTLVSGTNIKTVNSQSLLGSGNIEISGGGAVDSVNTQTGDVVLDADDISDATTTNKFVQQEVVTTLGGDNTTIPTSKAVADAIGGAGGGDMLKTVYDPTNINADAFDMDNMAEGATTKIFTDVERTKLTGIEANADVTDSTNVNAAGAVMESDYSPAHSLLVQQSGTGSPETVSIGNNEILGRQTGGGSDIEGLSATQVRSIINVEDGAEENLAFGTTAGTVLEGSKDALYAKLGSTNTFTTNQSISNTNNNDTLNISSEGMTTSNAFDVVSNTVTSGRLARFLSNSESFSSSNGLVDINVESASATGTALRVKNDGTGKGLFLDQNGNSIAQFIDTEATTSDGVVIQPSAMTTGDALKINNTASFTTGNALNIDINSAGMSGELVFIRQDNATATGRVMYLRQDGSGDTLYVDTNGSGNAAIFDGGNVGIGTTSPGVRLSFGVHLADKSFALYEGVGGSPFYGFGANGFATKVWADNVNIANFTSTGLGIGTTTPGSKLSVVGLPTSSSGLSAGDIWIDGTTLKIVT